MSSKEKEFDFFQKLQQEIETWLREGLISQEQKTKILSRYKLISEVEKKAGPGKLITTITILGSILIGIGVILFIAANWSEIPRWGKLFIIFSSMLISYGLGFYLRYEKANYPKVGASLIFLGSLLFGAGIFLIAQIYHIQAHYPNGPLLWGLGVLPLAYLLRLKTILSLAVIDLLIWLGLESSSQISFIESRGPMPFITLYLMTGISLWATGLMHKGFESLKTISAPYIACGLVVTFSSGYILTFDVFRGTFGSKDFIPFYIGIVALFSMASILYAFSEEKEKSWFVETCSLTFFIVSVFLLSLIYRDSPLHAESSAFTKTALLISNIIFALGVIGIIFLGYIRRSSAYINIGLLFFVLDVVARYFDFFWKLLPRSLFFIVGGILLLSGGVFLERKRRKIIASFHMEYVSQ